MVGKPVIIVVPGAWHSPVAYASLNKALEAKGYRSKVTVNVSIGQHADQPVNFDGDVENIRQAVQEVVDAGSDVVLMMHSYGGIPGTEAMKHFMDDNVGRNGKGRILRMVWICSMVPTKGDCLMTFLRWRLEEWHTVNKNTATVADPYFHFYNDISEEEAAPYIAALQPHAISAFASCVTVESWAKIPSSYVMCENDQAIPLTAQERIVATVKAIAPKAFDIVEKWPSSHSPFISMPNRLADFLIKSAQEV